MSSTTLKTPARSARTVVLPIRLIIRGDDAGASETANEAIKLACKAGTLRNVSVMACGPAFKQAAAMLRRIPGVCFGLHVTLTSEWPDTRWGPVSGADRCPSLVRADGTFQTEPMALQRLGFSLDEAVFEVESQLARLRAAGITPAYLDEHMGVGWLPGLRAKLADLAKREGLLDVDAVPFDRVPTRRGILCADAPSLVGLLQQLNGGTCLHVTHPDFTLGRKNWPGGELNARVRDADRRLLLAPDLLGQLHRAGVELTTFPEAMKHSAVSRPISKA